MAIYYIGSFPPSYGGVTIKNKNLYEALPENLDVCKIDMNRIKGGDVREMLRFAWAMLTGKQYIIGLAGQKNRRQFTKLMYRFKRKAMGRSVMLVMSGVVEDMIQAGPDFLAKMNTYRRVYLEFPGMARKLEAAGVTNAAVYPNGRLRPAEFPPIVTGKDALQCVFFSLIEPEKGVDRILEAAKALPDVQFHFYGKIIPSYQDAFMGAVEGLDPVQYHGVFEGASGDAYAELGKYDVLLLPTRCKTEGLPGILIESKIAGLPCVISDINYNREVVTDGVDGVILSEDTAQALVRAIRILDDDRNLLFAMKHSSRETAAQYYIDVCAENVIKDLLER